MQKAEKLATHLIKTAPVLHLATSDKAGQPSNCALEFIEKDGCFYWRSGKNSKHSRNLTVRKVCSVCITKTNADGSGEGVQTVGSAVILKHAKEISTIKRLLDKKIAKSRSEDIALEEDSREYWMFTPKKTFYMNENVFGYGRVPVTRSK